MFKLQFFYTRVNSVGGFNRSSGDAMKKWADWKSRTRAKAQRRNKFLSGTGNGEVPKKLIVNDLEEKLLSLMPRVKIHGLSSGIDTEAPLLEKQTMSQDCQAEKLVENEDGAQQTSSKRKRKNECCSCVQDEEACTLVQLTKRMLEESVRRNELLTSIANSLQYMASRHIADTVLGEFLLPSNN